MSDQPQDASEPDAETAAGEYEPGGGPRRVVSEESVDDILNSLNETEAQDSDDFDPTDSGPNSDSEREHESAQDDALVEPSGSSDSDSETADGSNDGADDETANSSDTGANNEPTNSTDEETSNGATETDTSTTVETAAPLSVDDAAASLPTDTTEDSLEELAARVEQGSVTGADVRAAEAGDDRESTPEVDEIELTMDDLDTTETTAQNDVERDAGPLAGSIDDSGDDTSSAEETEETDDDEPGLLGRITRFFSR